MLLGSSHTFHLQVSSNLVMFQDLMPRLIPMVPNLVLDPEGNLFHPMLIYSAYIYFAQVTALSTGDTANYKNKNPALLWHWAYNKKSYNILKTSKCYGENTVEMEKREKPQRKKMSFEHPETCKSENYHAANWGKCPRQRVQPMQKPYDRRMTYVSRNIKEVSAVWIKEQQEG